MMVGHLLMVGWGGKAGKKMREGDHHCCKRRWHTFAIQQWGDAGWRLRVKISLHQSFQGQPDYMLSCFKKRGRRRRRGETEKRKRG